MEKKFQKPYKWDFFITHSSKDKPLARDLYHILTNNNFEVFLDEFSILPGTDWASEISDSLKKTRITVVLITSNTNESFFSKAEVDIAINLSRAKPDRYKLIPVYLAGFPSDSTDFIFGLRLLQGISLPKEGSIERVAQKLIDTLSIYNSRVPPLSQPQDESEHILSSFPTGPMVESNLIPRVIIESYSNYIKESEAKLVVSEANAFRREVNPDTPYIIAQNKISSPHKISAFDYWMEVFDYARLQGPRMLAALLLTVPDDLFDIKTKIARNKLLEFLRNHHS